MIQVTADPIDAGRVIEAVRDPGAGAVVVFIGTVRDNADGRPVNALEYEAYVPMAERKMAEIAADVQEEWGARAAMVHRVGRLAVGEISVVIAISAPHRAEAFAACRAAIDELKEVVPVWKKEFGPGGHRTAPGAADHPGRPGGRQRLRAAHLV